ncbi:unnamed protein product [Arabidopsis lyrata]|nr:unnamed protein product [Arabidopsis lyrata]
MACLATYSIQGDSGSPSHEMAASDKEKASNVVPLVRDKDQLGMMNNSTGRKSRVTGEKELTQEPSQMIAQDSDEIFPKQSDVEHGVAREHELVDKNKILGAAVNGTLKSALESASSEPLGKDVDSQPQKNDYQKLSVKGSSKQRDSSNKEKSAKQVFSNQPKVLLPVVEKMRAGFRDNYMAARERETQEPGTVAESAEVYRSEYNDELEWVKDEKLRDIVFLVRDNELAGRDPFHLIDAEGKSYVLERLGEENGISVYDPPEKIIPRWKGPSLGKKPEFLNNYHERREALFSGKAASLSSVKYEEQSSHQEFSASASSENTLTPSSEITSSQPKIAVVLEKQELHGKETEQTQERDGVVGPQAVMSKYREYGKDKEEDYLWWLDLLHVLCLELYTVDDKGEQQVGFYTLEMATDLELEPKPHHVIAFENAADCRNLCYIIQAHLDMLRTGNVFIVARPPKDAFREAKANGFGVTVIRKGELKLNIDEPLEEVEEEICEIGSKMYHDKIMGDRSVDISDKPRNVYTRKKKAEEATHVREEA